MIRFHRFPASALLAATSLLACNAADDGSPADEYRNSLPTAETMTVKVPGQMVASSSSGDVQKTPQALLGETAAFYRLTRDVSRSVNGGVIFVLKLVRDVVRHTPTAVTDNTAVWGPFSEALSPNAWKVTVTKMSATEYAYQFQGKAKNAPDSAFVTLLSGTHRPTLGPDGRPIEGFGEGNFVLDFDSANTLPEHGEDVGVAMVTYSRRAVGVSASIAASFEKVRDEERPGRRVDVDYLYVENPNGGGELDFTFEPDAAVIKDGEPGKMAVKSRWLPTGAGRSDVQGTGGKLAPGTAATASECWDAAFASNYLTVSWDAAAGWGAAASCVYDAPVYSTLML